MKIKGSTITIIILCIIIAVCIVYIINIKNSDKQSAGNSYGPVSSSINSSNDGVAYIDLDKLPGETTVKELIRADEEFEEATHELTVIDAHLKYFFEEQEGTYARSGSEEKEMRDNELGDMLGRREAIRARLRELLK